MNIASCYLIVCSFATLLFLQFFVFIVIGMLAYCHSVHFAFVMRQQVAVIFGFVFF